MPSYTPIAQRWLERAPTGSPEECWAWKGPLRNGYGTIWDGDRKQKIRVHRFSYERAFGEIPHGLCVCHRCDNRACINPAHLFLGTRAQNLEDMRQKDRGAKAETHGRRKLTWEQVNEIRAAAARGEFQPDIAARFGVCRETVCLIHKRRIWK